METVYVINKDGTPLMPTTRMRHVRYLLNKGKARIVSKKPYVIRLKYQSKGITQPLYGGTDVGRTNIGNAVIQKDGTVVYQDHVETRNKEIPDLMRERAGHRRQSRAGERKGLQRMAVKHKTVQQGRVRERKIPGCDKPITLHEIVNDEARFANRIRPDGWLTPTAKQLVLTHTQCVKNICKILPVTHWAYEWNRFAFMRMEDGTVYGTDFQNGRLKGYASVNDYIYARQEGKCFCCDNPIEHYHHVVPRSKGGSNTADNQIGVCEKCHHKIHRGKITLSVDGIRKKYNALSILNQAVPYFALELFEMFGTSNVFACDGYETKEYRESNGLRKAHDNDAVCIAAIGAGCKQVSNIQKPYEVKQFRRHNRQILRANKRRVYKLDGKVVCYNRHKAEGQTVDSLEEFREKYPNQVGSLTVNKSKHVYNDMQRVMPGAIFKYRGELYILTGTKNNGTRYCNKAFGASGVAAKQCHIVRQNTGLVYLQ
ncbi:MAG: RRXRR domain-containing protein [Eubacteriales bacterium]|nr:RRXRR domain-containing protein [Eubacteriales bacterium]